MALTTLASDDVALKAALAAADLPTDDLSEDEARYFVWTDPDGARAFAGLIRLGDEALLRSVVVPENARGRGLGRGVTAAIAALAADAGVKRLWLLTTGAQAFFAAQGWTHFERGSAPAAVLATRQFSRTCPASATLMVRTSP